MANSVNERIPDNEETSDNFKTDSADAALEELRRELKQEIDNKLLEFMDGLEKGSSRQSTLDKVASHGGSCVSQKESPQERRVSHVVFRDTVSERHFDVEPSDAQRYRSISPSKPRISVVSEATEDSSVFDGSTPKSDIWFAGASDRNLLRSELTPLLRREHKRTTLTDQATIAKAVSTPLRVLGVTLGFITVVCLWEATDGAMRIASQVEAIRLAYYLMLTASASLCLTLSHEWVAYAESTLLPSFAYALSTLFAAIGGWGVLVMSVRIVVPEKLLFFCWLVAGLVCLGGSLFYAVQTRHNVILDIASCATSLGLEGDDNPVSYSRLSVLT